MAMASEPYVYEARYGWDRRRVSAVVAGVVAVTTAFDVTMPVLPAFALSAAGVLLVLWGLLRRGVAFRVDATGVTLGGPPRWNSASVMVPWADVMGVVLWHQLRADGSLLPYVGLQRRPGLPPLPETTWGQAQPVTGALASDVPADVVSASRPVHGWRLERRSLVHAVAHFAPGVPVQDHGTGELLTG